MLISYLDFMDFTKVVIKLCELHASRLKVHFSAFGVFGKKFGTLKVGTLSISHILSRVEIKWVKWQIHSSDSFFCKYSNITYARCRRAMSFMNKSSGPAESLSSLTGISIHSSHISLWLQKFLERYTAWSGHLSYFSSKPLNCGQGKVSYVFPPFFI